MKPGQTSVPYFTWNTTAPDTSTSSSTSFPWYLASRGVDVDRYHLFTPELPEARYPCFDVQVVNEGPIKNQSAPQSLRDSCLRKDTNLKSAAACIAETQAHSHKSLNTYHCRFCPQTSAIKIISHSLISPCVNLAKNTSTWNKAALINSRTTVPIHKQQKCRKFCTKRQNYNKKKKNLFNWNAIKFLLIPP